MKRTVKKGRHWSLPTIKRVSNPTFTVRAEHPDMWKYLIDKSDVPGGNVSATIDGKLTTVNRDQYDWNKLIGIKKNFFSPRKNSTMIGWRYNPITDCVEFVPYWHDENGGAHFDYKVFRVPFSSIEAHISINIGISHSVWSVNPQVDIRCGESSRQWLLPQNAYMGKGWLIANRFGGQQKAPKDITFEYEI
jgi:hypothetical protein